MKTIVVYKTNTEHERQVIDFTRDFKRQTGHDLILMDPESPEGVAFCEAYGIWEFPTVIAISDNSSMQQMWTGLPLPTIMEVSYYV